MYINRTNFAKMEFSEMGLGTNKYRLRLVDLHLRGLVITLCSISRIYDWGKGIQNIGFLLCVFREKKWLNLPVDNFGA